MAKKNKPKQPQTAQPAPVQEPKPYTPVLGAPYTFVPAAFLTEKSAVMPGGVPVPRAVTGKITYINRAHSYFTVTYQINGYDLRQSIKF